MIQELLTEKDERGAGNAPPHLSYSRINRYLHCPEQYRLYYLEKLRPRFPAAALVFGQVMHAALAQFFIDHGKPKAFFDGAWDEVRQIDLTYNQKESWEKLKAIGPGLLEKFQVSGRSRLCRTRNYRQPLLQAAREVVLVVRLFAGMHRGQA